MSGCLGDGLMDGRMDEWIDGRTDGRMDGWIDGRTDELMNVNKLMN